MLTHTLTKLLMTLTISVVASILVIGALIASPDAYSAKNNDVLDECKCEKPHTLIVLFDAPDGAPIDTTQSSWQGRGNFNTLCNI